MKYIFIAIIFAMPIFVGAQKNVQAAQEEEKSKTDPYKIIAAELLKNCDISDKKIAVAGFSYTDGRDSRDGGVLSERIATELVKLNKFKVVERKEIEKVFGELKLQRSGAIDSDSAKEIGKMLGANWVVVGTITELPDKQLEVNARLVDVESGEIINAYSRQVVKNWLDQFERLLAEQDKAVSENAKDANVFYEKGVLNTDLDKLDSAIAAFGIAVAIDPLFAKAYSGRGLVYILKNDCDKAIEDLSKAIEINPTDVAYETRGWAYEQKGELDKAVADYSKAIEANPQHPSAYTNRGGVYSSRGEYDKAIVDYSKEIAIGVNAGLAYYGRGNAYRSKGQYDKALSDWKAAIKLNPKLQLEIRPQIDALENK